MTKIGLLSDTHGWLDPRILEFFAECQEVWHCGDIGDIAVTDQLARCFTLRAVYGNVDGGPLRQEFSRSLLFTVEGVRAFMTHIGGYPGHYAPGIHDVLLAERPALFVCGHSHILKVQYDKSLSCLHVNPGAAGRYGIHHVRTAVRFDINGARVENLEVIELEK